MIDTSSVTGKKAERLSGVHIKNLDLVWFKACHAKHWLSRDGVLGPYYAIKRCICLASVRMGSGVFAYDASPE